MAEPLKIFIVDDSSLFRRILSLSVQGLPMPTVVETAPSGPIALKKFPAFNPDIMLLDIEMPEMNGVELLKEILKTHPRIKFILISGTTSRSADITIEGLTSGASDFIEKPTHSTIEENTSELKNRLTDLFIQLSGKIRARGALGSSTALAAAAAKPALTRKPPSILPNRVRMVGIGISTGGPNALEKVLPAIPENFPVPIVIVQHMPPLFTASLAQSLDKRAKLKVCEAKDGQEMLPGNVYIAPGGIHTTVHQQTLLGTPKLVIRLNDGPPVNSCKPAVDVLFHSLARVTGPNTLALVMTGMGQDGLDGVAEIKKQLGYCLTQSEETCVVYGMPAAVDHANLSDERVPLEKIANRIQEIVN